MTWVRGWWLSVAGKGAGKVGDGWAHSMCVCTLDKAAAASGSKSVTMLVQSVHVCGWDDQVECQTTSI